MKKPTRIIIALALILILLLGLGLMAYPMFSARYAQTHRSEAFGEYKEEVEQVDNAQIDAARAAAQVYNEKLFAAEIDILDPAGNGYYDQLALTGTQAMAYITIPQIDVSLPVFHGTADATLKAGAGHMPESSLPIGGANTHTVITAHSGMASEPMFSDLGLLKVGDIFQINVLNETLYYKVFDIPEPVLPQYVDVIQIQEGKDLCTLITCTPYGVNTHRLLIHAERTSAPTEMEDKPTEETTPTVNQESVWKVNYRKSLNIGIVTAVSIVTVFTFAVLTWRLVGKRKNEE